MSRAAYMKQWRADHREDIRAYMRVYNRTVVRYRRHGITITDARVMFKNQGGRCGACRTALTLERAEIDHDHTCCPGPLSCGKCVRALLCGRCNRTLGQVNDDADVLGALVTYLERNA